MQTIPWHEWICHSNFSFCIGASHPEEYVKEAHSLGYNSLGICDYDGIYGIVKAFRQHKSMTEAPRLFYGAEFHLACDHTQPLIYQDTLILYALNQDGYRILCHLISKAHEKSKREPLLPLEYLLSVPLHNLICLQPMRGIIRTAKTQVIVERYRILREAFGKNFFLILSRHLNPIEDTWIHRTQDLSKTLDIPLLFSQDCYFHREDRKEISDVLQAIRLNQTLRDSVPHLFINSERSFRPKSYLASRYLSFANAESILLQSEALAEQFQFSLDQLRYHYPQEFIPEGYTAVSYLEAVTWNSAKHFYKGAIPKPIYQLLSKELNLVKELGFADYFLTVWDIVCWARSKDILCQGRGSAANSAICFVLGITAVDPTEFDVLFERFISRERGDPPDIDVDFEHERREEVIQYIYQRYGQARSAMVANVICFRARSSLRAVGKALGIHEEWIQNFSSQQKLRFYHQQAAPNGQAISSLHETMSKPAANISHSDIPWDLWKHLAEGIQDFPHHLGIHSGGFVITQEPIEVFCAQEPATMEGRTVIQWAKDDIEYLNFFKIDILALGMLTALRKALHLIQTHYSPSMSLSSIPANDPATYKMIQRGDTVGTFQIESRAQMAMLPRLRPQSLYDLVIQIGIIRPGPIQGGLIHPYLRRRQGLEPIQYPDPRLVPILRRTMGVPIFQEQIMRIAITVGDFSPGEADQLRKHIGAWSLNKEWGPLVRKLELGMQRQGVEERYIQQILNHLRGFASYGFPESHAISFALIAYASAYIKCHYKEAFYTALLNSQPLGFYSPHALVQNARRESCEFLPIDITTSDWECTLEMRYDATGSPHCFIRLGLNLIKGLSHKTARRIEQIRQNATPWSSLTECLRSLTLPAHELASLAAANAFHAFGVTRPDALWIVAAGNPAPLLEEEELTQLPEESPLRQVDQDFESFSTTLGLHPCFIIREQHWMYKISSTQLTLSRDLAQRRSQSIVIVFGLYLMRQQPPTAKGMVFITLEDDTGLINLALTPDIAARYQTAIQHQGFLCIRGKLQKQNESHSILVEEVYSQERKDPKIYPLQKNKSASSNTAQEKSIRRVPKARRRNIGF